MIKLFREHPATAGETYWLASALRCSNWRSDGRGWRRLRHPRPPPLPVRFHRQPNDPDAGAENRAAANARGFGGRPKWLGQVSSAAPEAAIRARFPCGSAQFYCQPRASPSPASWMRVHIERKTTPRPLHQLHGRRNLARKNLSSHSTMTGVNHVFFCASLLIYNYVTALRCSKNPWFPPRPSECEDRF